MQQKEKGIIGIILLVIVALILLKFFLNWDVFDAASTDQGKSTILYARDLFNLIWHYIAAPVMFIWSEIVWPILSLAWNNFREIINMGQHAGQGICCTSGNSVY